MRRITFAEGEYYHIFNRGVDKRNVFLNEYDFQRFLKSMDEFNNLKPIGSIYENSFIKNKGKPREALVEFVAYCLNPNHYHFILRQIAKNGISKFMQRIGNGYTKYFNEGNKRNGALFQGKFKAVHIDSNEQLLYVSAYVNLNFIVHRLGHRMSKSSWEEYVGAPKIRLCNTSLIKDQFRNMKEYKKMAMETVDDIKNKRDMDGLLLEELN